MSTSEKPRILLYSHDTVGLGHIRRNQSIACGLARSLDDPAILMVSGARQSTLFDIPKCVDFVTIPSLRKSSQGDYKARNSGLSIGDAMGMRTEILRSVIKSFQPHVFVADKVPLGVNGELEPSLRELREQGAQCVLGLRDILDDPAAARRDWQKQDYDRAIEAYYDSVWVYGDQRVYDVSKEYSLSKTVAEKIQYVGYLDRSTPEHSCDHRSELPPDGLGKMSDRFALCMVGGGEDGAVVASIFAQSEFPDDMSGVVLTGPYMPLALREHLHSIATERRQLYVIDFMKRPEWLISKADRVVAMGGYNTVCEMLSYEKASLIIPRVTPRKEQLVRAERMQNMGLLAMLHPEQLSRESLSRWLHANAVPPKHVRDQIDLCGLDRLPHKVVELINRESAISQDLQPVPCCLRTAQASIEAKL